MYQGPASEVQAQKDSEDYLLGKIYKPKESKTMDLNVPGKPLHSLVYRLSNSNSNSSLSIVNISSKTDNAWMNKVSNKNDLFSRMHEDPFMMIKMEEKKQRDAVINNPMQMEKIRQKISKDLDDYHYQKEMKKKAKKELKKQKKEEKKKKKKEKKSKKEDDNKEKEDISGHNSRKQVSTRDDESISSSSSSEDEKESLDDYRARSPSPPTMKRPRETDDREDDYYPRDRERFRREESDNEDGRGRGRREERGRSSDRKDRSRDDSRDRRDWRDQRDSRRSDRSRDRGSHSHRQDDERFRRSDRSRSRDRRHNRDRDRDDSRHVRRDRDYDTKDKKPYEDHRNDLEERKNHNDAEENRSYRNSDEKEKKDGYGLVSRKPTTEQQSTEDKDYLGPRPDLLKKKEEERRKQIEEKAQRGRGGADSKKLSEEERLRRIAEMEKDAEDTERVRVNRLTTSKSNGEGEEKGLVTTDGKGGFLQSLRSEAYRQASENGLKDRLDQNRHYRQSSHEIDNSQNFLKR